MRPDHKSPKNQTTTTSVGIPSKKPSSGSQPALHPLITVAGMRIVTSSTHYKTKRTNTNQKHSRYERCCVLVLIRKKRSENSTIMYSYTQVVFCSVCLLALFGQMSASSIPMWEYLTKDEKMAYLFSMFKNQVDEYCEFSEMENCVDELTRFGLKKLRGMSEIQLDEMDPYQRGASSIIWNTLLQGHESIAKTTPKAASAQEIGGEPAASAKIDNVVRVPPPKGFVFNKPNALEVQEEKQQEAVEERFDSGVPVYRKVSPKFFRRPFEGPLVVKVYPDGRPVEDEQNVVVPQDEDLRQYWLAKVKLPAY